MKALLALVLSWFSLTSVAPAGSTPPVPKNIVWQDAQYDYDFFSVTNMPSLHLIPNYHQQLSVNQLIAQNHCTMAINGGFYSTDNKPLGLVLSDSTESGTERQSDLFNGFLSITDHPLISVNHTDNASIVLQSGPLLITDSLSNELHLASDKQARRMIAATDGDQLYFLTVYLPEAPTLGPYLADLPEIVQKISDQENWDLDNAINLDGGRASAYHSPTLTLTESDPVGSLFCVE